jgi:hypothetical protein
LNWQWVQKIENKFNIIAVARVRSVADRHVKAINNASRMVLRDHQMVGVGSAYRASGTLTPAQLQLY